MYLYIFADCTLYNIFIHILYIQIISFNGLPAKQTFELGDYVNMSKNKNGINTNRKRYGSFFPLLINYSPQYLRL